jgi:hypothetical protein
VVLCNVVVAQRLDAAKTLLFRSWGDEEESRQVRHGGLVVWHGGMWSVWEAKTTRRNLPRSLAAAQQWNLVLGGGDKYVMGWIANCWWWDILALGWVGSNGWMLWDGVLTDFFFFFFFLLILGVGWDCGGY